MGTSDRRSLASGFPRQGQAVWRMPSKYWVQDEDYLGVVSTRWRLVLIDLDIIDENDALLTHRFQLLP